MVLGYDVAEQLFPNGGELGAIVKIQSSGNTFGGIPFRVIGGTTKIRQCSFSK